MTTILLVCPEPLGHGRPAGVGIRFLELAAVLRRSRFDVLLLTPDGAPVPGCETGPITAATINGATAKCAAALIQGHVANPFFADARPIPTVVDLYDPFIVENLNYVSSMGRGVYDHDRSTLLVSLTRGDLFLCASEAQRLFWIGALIAAGRFEPERYAGDRNLNELIRIVPFGVPASREVPAKDPSAASILFGGIYDWYDPIKAIDAIAILRRSFPAASLTFNLHPNPDLTPQGRAAEAIEYARKQGFDWVHFVPWAPYSDREGFYDQFTAALLTFPRSLETDLAMRTRLFDYLWGGLPIVSSSAPGTDEILRSFGCGSVVTDGDADSYAAALRDLISEPSRYGRAVAATREFSDSHGWDRLAAPLVEFCRNPAKHESTRVTRSPPADGSLLRRFRRAMGGQR